MRLSHWDFRPKKRRKYVVAGSVEDRSALPRKRLTLRILLLVTFGVLVYWKYDSFIRSPLAQTLLHPEILWRKTTALLAMPSTAPAVATPAETSADSLWMRWTCASPKQDSCVEAWIGLESAEKGRLRALLWKARLRGNLPEPDSFSVVYRRNSGMTDDPDASAAEDAYTDLAKVASWRLDHVKLAAGGRTLTLSSLVKDAGTESFCAREDGAPAGTTFLCLDMPAPHTPLAQANPPRLIQERPPVITFLPAGSRPVHPVLPGMVTDLPAAGGGWLKVHHGGTLFSYYSGFTVLSPGMQAGCLVGIGDTLGFAGSPDSAAASATEGISIGIAETETGSTSSNIGRRAMDGLHLRIERDGSPVDPLAFLGLESDSGKLAHVP